MLNLTVGPVQSSAKIRKIGGGQIPYFRTEEFSAVMKENEMLIKKFAGAPIDARAVFLTGSGTAAMEAAVMNVLTPKDRALVVNGGSFGQRFADLCRIHSIPFEEIRPEWGKTLTKDMLWEYEDRDFTVFLVNVHETSSGVLYDMDLISSFCRKNGLLLIVDAISSFLADELDMKRTGMNVMITSSQKALACPPGISVIIADGKAVRKIHEHHPSCMYLNLKDALEDGERGQTPFTPAVGTLLQINARLREIDASGGAAHEIERISMQAADFRRKIKGFPFMIASESVSNAITPLHPLRASAYHIFQILKDEYRIWVCPNGGDRKHEVFRVGHIGTLTTEDNDTLVEAFRDMQTKGQI